MESFRFLGLSVVSPEDEKSRYKERLRYEPPHGKTNNVVSEQVFVFAYADCLFSHEEVHIKLKYTSSFNSIFIFLAYFNSWCDMTGTHSFAPLLLTNALLKSVDEKYVYVLRLNVPVNNFSVMWGRSQGFLGLTSTVGSKCVLLKDTTW